MEWRVALRRLLAWRGKVLGATSPAVVDALGCSRWLCQHTHGCGQQGGSRLAVGVVSLLQPLLQRSGVRQAARRPLGSCCCLSDSAW